MTCGWARRPGPRVRVGVPDGDRGVAGPPLPSDGPEAELWMGAHPGDRPCWPRPDRLDAAILADPAGLVGAEVVEGSGRGCRSCSRSSPRPSRCRCRRTRRRAGRAGFDAEDAAGVPGDAPHRTYVDRHHKPELLVALSEFDALCGFRRRASGRLLAALDVRQLHRCRRAAQPRPGRRAARRGHRPADDAGARSAGGRRWWRRPARPGYELVGELAATYPATPGWCSRCCSTGCGWRPARRSGCRPATCTPTSAAPASRSWPRPTTCCAAA